jgi:fatty-acid peroxygenase
MSDIPRDPAFDATLDLLRDGYEFLPNRFRRLGTDVFETRLTLSRVVCGTGEEAARVFYQPGRFTRNGAMPPTTLKLLQDRGSVALLDADAHRHRKQLFLQLLDAVGVARLTAAFTEQWRAAVERWEQARRVVLHDAVEGVLCRAACEWAGVPLTDAEAGQRTREFAAMIDGAGAVGPRNWKGLFLRRRTERWARGLIERVRAGSLGVPDGAPLSAVAVHADTGGRLLDPESAAVELLNLLRPIVAVARYVTFAAHALHTQPAWRERLRAGAGEELTAFAQEVRRYYPFFPFVGGRVLDPFDWRGWRFERGEWFLLDLYGTNRDARIWGDPAAFRPERFLGRGPAPFDLIPQGGGGYADGHRCPGEPATVAVLTEAVRLLTAETSYSVPEQDLRIDLARMPTLPASRLMINGVSRRHPTAVRVSGDEGGRF